MCIRDRGCRVKQWQGRDVTPEDFTRKGVKLCDEITWGEWTAWWKKAKWQKAGGRS